jgi:hypothetical protein
MEKMKLKLNTLGLFDIADKHIITKAETSLV